MKKLLLLLTTGLLLTSCYATVRVTEKKPTKAKMEKMEKMDKMKKMKKMKKVEKMGV